MSEPAVFENCTFTTHYAPGWQPIETAPEDGTAVLLHYPQGVYDDEWNDFEGRSEPCCAVMSFRNGSWVGYYDATSPNGTPTHWMPLPSPPEG